MRYFFKFLFRHEWDIDIGTDNTHSIVSRLRCKHCGIATKYMCGIPNFDIWWGHSKIRGCPGKI